ncbi:hypothetical protein E1211_30520 [Micromonospora sp. 15K316]|uniref:hypothetical protein n=1 Tax=Micromonospora sp. 15K316 TaxID=2530376 RepID=UPI0010514EC4|nr:hypothetical protein [Micromonospora sp. 15K316]TDC25942.1 hypothetical protein E1211_30520 [Micromonospora sp. 15K316]
MIGFMVNNAPGGYLLGALMACVGGGLIYHLVREWRRVARRRAIARQHARFRHPATRYRMTRVVRAVGRAPVPGPRPAAERAAQLPGWTGGRVLLPTVERGSRVPQQRGGE